MATTGGNPWMHTGLQVRSVLNNFLLDVLDTPVLFEASDEDLEREVSMHDANSLPGFPSPDTFEYLALPYLERLMAPSVECVHEVATALELLARQIAWSVFRRCPKLAEVVIGMVQDIIQRERESTRIIVEQQVMCHTGYLFTNDQEYMLHHGFPAEVERNRPSIIENAVQSVKGHCESVSWVFTALLNNGECHAANESKPCGKFAEVYRMRLNAYFALTVNNVRDGVPKLIGFYLIRAIQDKLQFELLNALNQGQNIEELFGEPTNVTHERKQLGKQLQILQTGTNVLAKNPTLAALAVAKDSTCEMVSPIRSSKSPAHVLPVASVQRKQNPKKDSKRPDVGMSTSSTTLALLRFFRPFIRDLSSTPHQLCFLVLCTLAIVHAARTWHRLKMRHSLLYVSFPVVASRIFSSICTTNTNNTKQHPAKDRAGMQERHGKGADGIELASTPRIDAKVPVYDLSPRPERKLNSSFNSP